MHFHRVFQAFSCTFLMHFSCISHASLMHFSCISHASLMHFSCISREFFIHFSYIPYAFFIHSPTHPAPPGDAKRFRKHRSTACRELRRSWDCREFADAASRVGSAVGVTTHAATSSLTSVADARAARRLDALLGFSLMSPLPGLLAPTAVPRAQRAAGSRSTRRSPPPEIKYQNV